MIDTPGNDTFLMRLAHSMADTLITPINDSFLDLDVLAALDPVNFAVTGESHHAKMVREARRQRRLTDGRMTDWVVVRNRLSRRSKFAGLFMSSSPRETREAQEGAKSAAGAARPPLGRSLSGNFSQQRNFSRRSMATTLADPSDGATSET